MKVVSNALIRLTTTCFTWVVFIALTSIVLIVFLQIFFRYLLRAPLFWSEELAKFIFPWLIFSGAALASKADNHIRIDVVADRLPPAWRPVLDKVVRVLSFLFCALIVLYTVPLAQSQVNVTTTALGIPINWFSLSVVIGAIGMIIYLFWGERPEKRA